MRWQFKAGAILAAAVLVFAGVRLFSADAADAQPADPPRQAAAATPPSPAPAPAGTPPPQAAPAHQPPPPPERPLPPRFTDYLAREYPNSAATRQALTQIAYGWSQAVNDVRGPQDAKLAEALQTIDDPKREKLLQEATEIGMRDYGVIPLYFNINVWAARKGYTVVPRLDERTYAFDVAH